MQGAGGEPPISLRSNRVDWREVVGLIDGKVVLVTGAGGGMGRAGAEIFAREGARHVYVVDLKVDGGEETVELVRKQGGDGTFVAADVTDEESVAAVIGRAVKEHGRLDCAWNNAGISDVSKAFTDFTK